MENSEAAKRNFHLKQATLWERVFYHPDEILGHIKAEPGNCTVTDLEEFKEYSNLIRTTNPDGYITFTHIKTICNGYQLSITFHEIGFKELEVKEA